MPEEAPALVDIIGPLVELTGLAVALGLVMLLDGFLRGLFGALQAVSSWVPFGGSITSSVLHSAEHAISSALGKAINAIESKIGHEWHNFATYMHRLWNYQVQVAENLFHVAQRITRLITTGDVARLWHRLTAHVNTIVHNATRTVVRDIHKTIMITATVPRHLARRLHAVEHAIADTIPREIKTARDLAKEAEQGVARLWDRVRSLEQKITPAAIAAAVAVALAAIGLDWIACRNRNSVAGRSGCDLWDALEQLLAVGLVTFAIPSLEEFTREGQAVIGEVAQVTKDTFGV